MILGVMSDTHGNVTTMHRVAELMVRRFGADVLFHLGDDYADAEELLWSGYEIRRVPGLWCPEYLDDRVPKRIVESFDGLTVAAAHAEKDLRHTERAASIVLLGHTHEPRLALLGASLYVNPGHLREPASKGFEPTFAMVRADDATVFAAIHDVNGTPRQRLSVPRSKLA